MLQVSLIEFIVHKHLHLLTFAGNICARRERARLCREGLFIRSALAAGMAQHKKPAAAAFSSRRLQQNAPVRSLTSPAA
jgi:hypothetical protein